MRRRRRGQAGRGLLKLEASFRTRFCYSSSSDLVTSKLGWIVLSLLYFYLVMLRLEYLVVVQIFGQNENVILLEVGYGGS